MGKRGGLTDTDRTTPYDDDVLCVGKLAAPGVDMGQYLAFAERKVDGPIPLGPRGNDEDGVWDAVAALKDDVRVFGLYRADDADSRLAVSVLEESVEGDECGLFELCSLADDETEGSGEGYGI